MVIYEGRVGFRKNPFLMGKSVANECNESLLSNCRVQLALSTKKDGMILEILIKEQKLKQKQNEYSKNKY